MQSTCRLLRSAPLKQCFTTVSQPSARCLSTLPRRPQPLYALAKSKTSIRPLRFNSSLAVPQSEAATLSQRPSQPSYQLTFTCKPCKHRSAHIITKHGYHKGTVLIKCPSCSNRHVISDHLKIFMDEKSTLEDILRKKAGTEEDITKLLKKGKLGMRQGDIIGREGDEDIEFWDDGTETQHTPAHPEP